MENNKTICAISTPIGNGGISIVRMSGKNSRKILQCVTDLKTKNMQARKKNHRSSYGDVDHMSTLISGFDVGIYIV